MKNFTVYTFRLLIFLGTIYCYNSCKKEVDPVIVIPQVVVDSNELFYKFGNLSGRIYNIAFDRNGNIYASDMSNNVILKIDKNYRAEIFAGSGQYSHIDGTNKEASFLKPMGLVFDKNDNLYVTENFFIRRINSSGYVSTIAGSFNSESSLSNSYRDGNSLQSKFSSITSIAIDSKNNLYVTDSDNSRLRKVSPDSLVSTVAGTGIKGYTDGNNQITQFNYPYGVSVDSLTGRIYVSDWNNSAVRLIDKNNTDTFIGGTKNQYLQSIEGSVKLKSPSGSFVDSSGNLYVVDTGNRLIYMAKPNGSLQIIQIDKNGPQLHYPTDIKMYQNFLYIADSDKIVKIALNI